MRAWQAPSGFAGVAGLARNDNHLKFVVVIAAAVVLVVVVAGAGAVGPRIVGLFVLILHEHVLVALSSFEIRKPTQSMRQCSSGLAKKT